MKPQAAADQPTKTIKDTNSSFSFETTQVDGMIYNVEKLVIAAEHLPTQQLPLEFFRDAVGPEHHYWIDQNGRHFGPAEILADWQKAQQNPAWQDHIDTIRQADTNHPIWATKTGQVFDGMHRLTRAFVDHQTTIPVKIFNDLPEAAIVGKE